MRSPFRHSATKSESEQLSVKTLADTANTCEVSLTSSLSEGFRQDDRKKGSKDLKFFFDEAAGRETALPCPDFSCN